MIYVNDKLLIIGGTESFAECKHVQYLDLKSNKTGVYENTIGCGYSAFENMKTRNRSWRQIQITS